MTTQSTTLPSVPATASVSETATTRVESPASVSGLPSASSDPATTEIAPGPPLLLPPTTPFSSNVSGPLTAGALGASWREGCPVAPAELRRVEVSYVDFDGATHVGSLVVNASVVAATLNIFRALYEAGFPQHGIKEIVTQADYDDFETPLSTGFSCRPPLGGSGYSQHSYGTAIDINPLENPYVRGSTVSPSGGAAYLNRGDVRPGMITAGDAVVQAFTANGFSWGAGFGDYQHFSTTGT